MSKQHPINRIVIEVEGGAIVNVVADNPKGIVVTVIDRDITDFSQISRAPDGEEATVEDYAVGKLLKDHDKWLLTNKEMD